ncbi:MAG: alkaline phosphatase [Hyphomonas sp.]
MRLPALAASLAVLAACATAPEPVAAAPEEAAAATPAPTIAPPKQIADAYYAKAASAVDARIEARGTKPAKNVILFVGDGMGISTITAARIYAGQSAGVDGESYHLAMDDLDYSALSKTYSHNFQIADSAGTAVAMVSGIKTLSGVLGVDSNVSYGNCASVPGTEVDTLFELAARAGLSTGLVSTARVTHATPAAAYAKAPLRDWEADSDMKGASSDTCKDIARQLIEWPEGSFDIVLGGGRSKFLTKETPDPEYDGKTGDRTDGRNLTEEWAAKSDQHKVVFDKAGFDATDFTTGVKVLGLFEPSHMQFELDREADTAGEPHIAELTAAAITRLSQNDDGYVLMVEGGRIDHAHHGGNAIRALEDTMAFDAAIATALEMTNPEDTLIIVTADHSHTLTIAGYAARGNPILGLSVSGIGGEGGANGSDGLPYTTLGYANGPGACIETGKDADGKAVYECKRQDLTGVDTLAPDFRQPALVPMYSETHGGEDVAALASGPGSNLITGVIEQNELFHVMGRALGLIPAPAAD